MKITFLSNFYNHHQMPLSRSLNKHLNGDYSFIAQFQWILKEKYGL